MKENRAKAWLVRILAGGLFGWALQLFVASSFASIGGTRLRLEFSMLIFGWNTAIPYDTADKLAAALMFLIGVEIGLSTLPFPEYGKSLRLETVLHFAVMMLTVTALGWVLDGRWGIICWTAPSALLYALIWLGRWVGWYAELAQIREKLGIGPKPSPLKWRETLPHAGFAFLLCTALPLALAALDRDHITSLLFILLLMPAAGFAAGASLGKRQGFCPLYPLACGASALAALPFIDPEWWVYPAFAFLPALAGNLLGCAVSAVRRWAGSLE